MDTGHVTLIFPHKRGEIGLQQGPRSLFKLRGRWYLSISWFKLWILMGKKSFWGRGVLQTSHRRVLGDWVEDVKQKGLPK